MALQLEIQNYKSILNAFSYTMINLLSNESSNIDKPLTEDAWSLRQHVYHLLDTPLGGLHEALSHGLLNPNPILEVIPDLDNLNCDRKTFIPAQIIQDINTYRISFNQVLDSYDNTKLDSIIIKTHFPKRNFTEDRTARTLLDRLFIRHWSEHLYDITN